MKFKYLVLVFSIIIIFILLMTAFMPLLITGHEAVPNPLLIALPLTAFMVLLLICFGLFFILNYRLFSLLEKEDWPALAYYLEQKVFIRGYYSNRNVRLLASAYIVMTDYLSVIKLESKAAIARPSVIDQNVLIFGSARILSGKYNEAEFFFKTRLDRGAVKEKDKEWARWFYSFSQLLNGSFSKVEGEFIKFADSSDDAVITGLSAYFLFFNLAKYSLKPYECTKTAENNRNRILKTLRKRELWKKETKKMSADIHIAIIKKYIDETENWIYAD